MKEWDRQDKSLSNLEEWKSSDMCRMHIAHGREVREEVAVLGQTG